MRVPNRFQTVIPTSGLSQVVPAMRTFSRPCVILFSLALAAAINLSAQTSSVVIASSANPSTFGHSVTFTATVTPANATGSVTFFDGVTVLGTSAVSSGRATLATTLLPSGVRSLTAYYAGDGSHAASRSAFFPQKVNALLQQGFAPPVVYSVGVAASPSPIPRIVVADFNGDGSQDVVSVNSYSSSISVILGNGDGTFKPAITQVVYNSNLESAIVGDFNGDGKPDLALVNSGNGYNLNILLGNGDGTFQAPIGSYPIGNNQEGVVVGDFNGDGNADLAISISDSSNVAIVLGNGDGTFQAPGYFAVGTNPHFIAIGDFNGDGKADLVTANNTDNSVSILLGNGDGTFGPNTDLAVGMNPNWVTVADLNGDGKADIVAANNNSCNVSVLLGQGNGTFQPAVNYAVGLCIPGDSQNPNSVAVADANGDGIPDLFVGNNYGANVSILLGNGDGTFQTQMDYSADATGHPQAIAVGHFSANGGVDIAVGSYNSNSIDILLGLNLITPQTISFAPANVTFGVAPFTVAATASSGLAVSLSSSTQAVCTVSGSTVTIASAGTCTLTANQAGNVNYSAATPVMASFTVNKASQTITFGSLSNVTLPAGPVALFATSTSGLQVSFVSTTSSVCTVSANSVSPIASGTCTVQASQAGNTNYLAAANLNQSFTVSQASQTIAFGALGNVIIGVAPFTIGATATSGLPVSFSSSTQAICTVSGSTVTVVAVGTCSVTASQAGNTTYAAATPVTQSFSVNNLTAQTIAFGSLGTQTLGTTPPPLSATATSGLPVTFTSNSPTVCTVSGVNITLIALGTCSITASQVGNATYAAATPVTQTFTVSTLLSQTITFGALGAQTLGTTPPPLSATATSGLTVAFASNSPTVCTVSGVNITLIAVGTCAITASQAGNATYATATSVTQTFAVSLRSQTIAFGALGNQTLGTAPPPLSATPTSGLAVTFASNTTSVCTVSGVNITLVAAGICSITASQAGNATYAAATPVTQTFAVLAASQTIAFASLSGVQLGVAPFTAGATASSGLPVSFASTTPTVCTVSGNTVTIVAIGTCSITASQAGNATYTAATPVTQSFAVTVKPSEVGVFRQNFAWLLDANGNRMYDGTGPGLDYFYANFIQAQSGDIPVVGDWSGSGTTKIGIYRPATGQWFLDYNGNGVFDAGDKTYSFGGIAGDKPVVGDWSGSGTSKIGIFRSGFFWLLDYNGDGTFDNGDQAFAFGGVAGDVPVAGDWTGDGKAKVGVVRVFFPGGTPAFWILDANNDHSIDAGDLVFAFGGITGDVAVVGDWNGTGYAKAGMFRAGFFWVVDNNGSAPTFLGGNQIVAFGFGGVAGDIPVVGKW